MGNMNKYRETLYKIAQSLRTFGGEIEALKLVQELLNDNDLLLVNKKCLPLKFEQRDNTFSWDKSKDYLEFRVGLQLTAVKKLSGCWKPMLNNDAKTNIANALIDDVYLYLENQNTPVTYSDFELVKYVDGKLVE